MTTIAGRGRQRMEQLEYFAGLRALRKKLHICQRCGEKDAYTMAGRSRCAECAAKDAEYGRQYYATHKSQKAAQNKANHEKKKSEGFCTRCCTRKPMTGRKLCPKCIAYMRAYRQEHKKTAWNWPRGANGFCWKCNKQPAQQGLRLCAACYEVQCNINRSLNNSRHIWRGMDREGFKSW